MISSAEIESYYTQFIKNTIQLSCDYQSRLLNGLRVTYCGVEGAYAHIAAKRMFPEAELVAFPDFTAAYEAVQSGEYDCVVLPFVMGKCGEFYSTWGAICEYSTVGDAESMVEDGLVMGEGTLCDCHFAQRVYPASIDPVAATMIVTFREV